MEFKRETVRVAAPRSAYKVLKQISPAAIKKFEIPDYALLFDGINLPEGAIYMTPLETAHGSATAVGDVEDDPIGKGDIDQVVIIALTDVGYIATYFHNVEDMGDEYYEDDDEEW